MSVEKLTREELELLSYKDITNLILEESKPLSTASLLKKIIKLLGLPTASFEKKIGDYYMSLTTDKRFFLLEDGNWDLRKRHTSDKIIAPILDEDEEIDEDVDIKDETEEPEEENDSFDSLSNDDDDFDDDVDDLKDLVVLDEELELEK